MPTPCQLGGVGAWVGLRQLGVSPIPSVTPFPPSSLQSHWQMELVMGVGRALLWGLPCNADLGAETEAWDAAGVLGPTLTLVGSWQPQICLLLMRSPIPVLSAPLVVWVRAALAHSSHHGCEPLTALFPIPGDGKFGFGGCSSSPVAFSFCLLCWKPHSAAHWWESWACHPKMGT